MAEIAKIEHPEQGAAILEKVLLEGDWSRLSPVEINRHFANVCQSLGLNPLTQPFSLIRTKEGKKKPYATKDCSEQLRKIHNITLEILSRNVSQDLATVHVRATMPSGRTDEDIGIVATTGLKGDALANAAMKCVTKAKRRVTLSICGLGWLDETEVETIPNVEHVKIDDTPDDTGSNPNPLSDKQKEFISKCMRIFKSEDPTTDATTADQFADIKKALLDDGAKHIEYLLTVADDIGGLAKCAEGITALESAKHSDAGALRTLYEGKRKQFISEPSS